MRIPRTSPRLTNAELQCVIITESETPRAGTQGQTPLQAIIDNQESSPSEKHTILIPDHPNVPAAIVSTYPITIHDGSMLESVLN